MRAGQVHVTVEQSAVPVPAAKVRLLARRILGPGRSVSIAFVTDAVSRSVNRRHLGHDYATDVISFPLGTDLFGELVISGSVARREARARGIPAEEELLRYVAHGLLHLLGYDDRRPADRRRMWARQERELRAVLRRPRIASQRGPVVIDSRRRRDRHVP